MKRNKILVTGNLGYIGSDVVIQLKKKFPSHIIEGFDLGLFASCVSAYDNLGSRFLSKQHFGDITRINGDLLRDFDAVIHLAAISNDPMGNLFEDVTRNINFGASVRLAELAKINGVRAFVFASSCSVYGGGSAHPKKETDTVEPLTAYAKSKIDTEIELKKLSSEDFCVTVLRFATACGWSERFRTDLVLNDFVTSAFVNGNVEILSDGQPYRPLICVKDMAKALAWGVQRGPELGGEYLVVNCGSNDWNFRIKDLAVAVSECIPNISVKFSSHTTVDKRSYQVDFSLYKELAPDCYPSKGLDKTIDEIWSGLSIMDSIDASYRNSKFMRLVHLKHLIDSKQLNEDIKWVV